MRPPPDLRHVPAALQQELSAPVHSGTHVKRNAAQARLSTHTAQRCAHESIDSADASTLLVATMSSSRMLPPPALSFTIVGCPMAARRRFHCLPLGSTVRGAAMTSGMGKYA